MGLSTSKKIVLIKNIDAQFVWYKVVLVCASYPYIKPIDRQFECSESYLNMPTSLAEIAQTMKKQTASGFSPRTVFSSYNPYPQRGNNSVL